MTALNRKIIQTDTDLNVREPTAEDGQHLYSLARESGALDLNSEYAYLLLGEHFSKTCAVAEEDGEHIGFLSAYIPPGNSSTLFVWQVAVDPEHRKRGLAKTMLKDILKREVCKPVRYIEASVTPSNVASTRFFESIASELSCNINKEELFPEAYFEEDGHEEEELIHIGPFVKATL